MSLFLYEVMKHLLRDYALVFLRKQSVLCFLNYITKLQFLTLLSGAFFLLYTNNSSKWLFSEGLPSYNVYFSGVFFIPNKLCFKTINFELYF